MQQLLQSVDQQVREVNARLAAFLEPYSRNVRGRNAPKGVNPRSTRRLVVVTTDYHGELVTTEYGYAIYRLLSANQEVQGALNFAVDVERTLHWSVGELRSRCGEFICLCNEGNLFDYRGPQFQSIYKSHVVSGSFEAKDVRVQAEALVSLVVLLASSVEDKCCNLAEVLTKESSGNVWPQLSGLAGSTMSRRHQIRNLLRQEYAAYAERPLVAYCGEAEEQIGLHEQVNRLRAHRRRFKGFGLSSGDLAADLIKGTRASIRKDCSRKRAFLQAASMAMVDLTRWRNLVAHERQFFMFCESGAEDPFFADHCTWAQLSPGPGREYFTLDQFLAAIRSLRYGFLKWFMGSSSSQVALWCQSLGDSRVEPARKTPQRKRR